MTITPTPELNYLTLVIAGWVMFGIGMEADKPKNYEYAIALGGIALFLIGTVRALMGAFNV